MHPFVRHGVLVLFSVMLIWMTVLLLPVEAKNGTAMHAVVFGYPFPFLTQDFSEYIVSEAVFERYVAFESRRPVSDFSWSNALRSFGVIFVVLEASIWSLERVKERAVRVGDAPETVVDVNHV